MIFLPFFPKASGSIDFSKFSKDINPNTLKEYSTYLTAYKRKDMDDYLEIPGQYDGLKK